MNKHPAQSHYDDDKNFMGFYKKDVKMKIPDLTVTDLVKNIICLLIIAATLLLYVQGIEPPTELKLISGAVLAGYGINVAQMAVTQAKAKASKETPPAVQL